MNIFMLVIDDVRMCNLKRITHREYITQLRSFFSLRSMEHLCVYTRQLIQSHSFLQLCCEKKLKKNL